MHFIEITRPHSKKKVLINAEKITAIFRINSEGTEVTRIIYDFEVGGDYAYEDVIELPSEIMKVC